LIEATGDGHCALPLELLKEEVAKLLLVEDKIVSEARPRRSTAIAFLAHWQIFRLRARRA
jgi:hypothetical protein